MFHEVTFSIKYKILNTNYSSIFISSPLKYFSSDTIYLCQYFVEMSLVARLRDWLTISPMFSCFLINRLESAFL